MQYSKKVMATFILLGVSFGASANSFYAGIESGIDLFVVKKHVTLMPAPPFPNIAPVLNERDAATGIVGGLYAGYEWHFENRFGVEAEINANLDTSSARETVVNWGSVSGLTATSNERLKFAYGASLLPEYYLTSKTKLFGRVGIQSGYFTTSSDNGSGGNLGATGNFDAWLVGYEVGGGVATALTHNLVFRAEYDYVQYGSKTFTSIEPNSGSTVVARYQPSANQILLSLNKHFQA